MEMADYSGKLFIRGISWDMDEDRLREYFGRFGEVTEAVSMRDRTTGRGRGFGFVVFADASVGERVTMDKHMIDGRMVEAKKAIPRDDHSIVSKRNASSTGSSGPNHTRKIFVGGLPSDVTEADFRRCFEQFGAITDVVVIYDRSTQRPRGFGFITYDSEDAVDKALHKSLHELNGKMVEVKRAIPKEQSPRPVARSSARVGQNYATNHFLNGFNQGYNMNPIGGYGMRMDGRYERSNSTGTTGEPFSASAGNAYEVYNSETYGSSSIYGGTTWRFASSEVDLPSLGHDLGNIDPDIKSGISASYMGNYTVNNNQPSTA
ncbi:heterogeneous nuclear ribonucleoprotein 1-like [Panicum miliaceum]|uniref:Heterogeneous nuclear ribonucleoprotein 1-like n=1 Tax=Panicum miliaceum TaxID=4540 RepID=A0A3L6QV22_PANMI|nr:heterogeneous nuclear ribonucleoprotein 1-like [Panicum miliaceum]